jgi:putative transposase
MYEYRQLTPEQRAELVQQRLSYGYPPHSPPHPIQDQQFYLLTSACYEHCCHINSEQRRKQLLDVIFEYFIVVGIEVRGWVILPNHYHVLVYLGTMHQHSENPSSVRSKDFSPSPSRYQQLPKAIKHIHGCTSRQWNLEDNSIGRKVWHAYSDRAIRSERHYYTTLNYIHYNPVKHGWAKSPYEFSCSSVHWYLAQEGREWLRSSWVEYPVKEYGQEWDNFSD